MADVHSSKTRSYNMSKIRSKDTKPELLVRKYLFAQGLRYRLHCKNLPGTPDIVLRKFKTVIFVHGCFWHRHEKCKYFVVPKTRTEWWLSKFNKNVENDKKNILALQDLGWRIIKVWECECKKKEFPEILRQLVYTVSKSQGNRSDKFMSSTTH